MKPVFSGNRANPMLNGNFQQESCAQSIELLFYPSYVSPFSIQPLTCNALSTPGMLSMVRMTWVAVISREHSN